MKIPGFALIVLLAVFAVACESEDDTGNNGWIDATVDGRDDDSGHCEVEVDL